MDCGVSSEILEWGSKYLHKSERGDENSIKYMRMSSTPSPQVINDPSLKSLTLRTPKRIVAGSADGVESKLISY